MESVILYGSVYGTARQYAEEISKKTGIRAYPYKNIKNISAYDRVIHVGGIYAGMVKGLSHTVKTIRNDADLIIVTVGIANTEDEKSIQHIKRGLQKQLPEDIYTKAKIFSLRGGIDYKKISKVHYAMMFVMHSVLKKKPQNELTTDDKIVLQSYGNKVDFMNLETVNPIVEYLK